MFQESKSRKTSKSPNDTPSRRARRARVPKSKIIRKGAFGGIVTRERNPQPKPKGVFSKKGTGKWIGPIKPPKMPGNE